MLHEFLAANRDELVNRCRAKVAERTAPQATAGELEHGIPRFLEQLITTLRKEQGAPLEGASQAPMEIGATAGRHGNELLRNGFSVGQVVHDYGDLCQSVTELASEKKLPIAVDDFRTFNRCLDNAVADAVTEFGRQRDQLMSAQGAQATNERLGSLAHELRNLLNTAVLAFDAIKTGNVAVRGSTGAVLDRSLLGLRDVIDRSLADVRLSAGLQGRGETISIREFVEELQVAAAMEAKAKAITFTILPVDRGLVVNADRHMLGSAISNLLQNAFKFSRTGGHVSLNVHATVDHVLIEVQDECGGLPPGKIDRLFLPFQQASADRSGIGLGLSIGRRAVEANGGKLSVRNLPNEGCVFTIELPRLLTT